MKILKIVIIIVFSVLSTEMMAQTTQDETKDTLWNGSGKFNITMGQSSFTNWTKGGENNMNANLLMHYDIKFNNENVNWENNIQLEYGGLVNEDREYKKLNDKIYLSSQYGLEFNDKLDINYHLNFRSQFTKGFKYPNDSVYISRFMAPAHFLIGLGTEYKPFDDISFLFSPLTNKLTIVNDEFLSNQGAYGVTPAVKDSLGNVLKSGKRIKNELGGYVQVNYKKEIKDFKIESKVEFFFSYKSDKEGVDVNWATLLSYDISKLFTATLNIDIVYDKDAIIRKDTNGDGELEELSARTQVREILSFGLSFKL